MQRAAIANGGKVRQELKGTYIHRIYVHVAVPLATCLHSRSTLHVTMSASRLRT